jgi:hypothetical protein
MAYEWEAQKDAIVNSVWDILEKAADGIQANELMPVLTDILSAVAAAQSVLTVEHKRIFRLKLAGKVGTGLANKGLDSIEDELNA